MSGRSSQQKGKRGEIEAAEILSDLLGVKIKREAAMYLPGFVAPDVSRVAGLHFEVKRRKLTALPEWLRQAKKDAGAKRVPVVVHRPNRNAWMLTIHLADLPALARAVCRIIKNERSKTAESTEM